MAGPRSGVALRRRRNKPGRNATLDAIFNWWYTAVFTTLSAGIRMGGLYEKDKERRSRSTQRAATGVETAKATTAASPTSATSTKATVSHSAGGIANSTRTAQSAAAVPTAAKARQTNGHQTEKIQVMHLALTLKKQNRLITVSYTHLTLPTILLV